MSKSKDPEMTTVIKTGTIPDFFESGKRLAKKLDAKRPISTRRIRIFEDPNDLLQFLKENNTFHLKTDD